MSLQYEPASEPQHMLSCLSLIPRVSLVCPLSPNLLLFPSACHEGLRFLSSLNPVKSARGIGYDGQYGALEPRPVTHNLFV